VEFLHILLHGTTEVPCKNRYNLVAGEYQVVVADHNGCTKNLDLFVTQPNAVVINLSATNVNCFGGNSGSITNTTSGGTAPYTYHWNDGNTNKDRTAIDSRAPIFVTATDAHQCTSNSSVTITQPDYLMVTGVVTEVSCHGANNGMITLTIQGGTQPFSYAWSDVNTNKDRTGLAPGSYTITVTDAHGCSANNNFTITQPSQLTISATTVNVSCYNGANGQINLLVSGATPLYSYMWSDGFTGGPRLNLTAGHYYLTVTDALQCTGFGRLRDHPAGFTPSFCCSD